MSLRFGVQDHSPQPTQHALQNPTPQGSFQNIGGGGDYARPHAAGYSYGADACTTSYVTAASGPVAKGYIGRVLLSFVLGPFGLLFTSRKGALVLLLLVGVAGVMRGGVDALSNDWIMNPIWLAARAASVVWTITAVTAYNRSLKESEEANKPAPAESEKAS